MILRNKMMPRYCSNDITWASLHFKHRRLDCLPNSLFRLTTKQRTFRVTGALWGESFGHLWIPLTKIQWCGNFPFRDVIMVSAAIFWPDMTHGHWVKLNTQPVLATKLFRSKKPAKYQAVWGIQLKALTPEQSDSHFVDAKAFLCYKIL